MEIAAIAAQNLTSPIILFFVLGIVAGLGRSSLTIPETLGKSAALYLMIAIGFRGGVELAHGGVNGSTLAAVLAAVALSALLPVLAYALLRGTTRIDRTNAAAVAAHYGSVSVVTFAAAIAVLNHLGLWFEPYIVALVAVMEAPAILTGLYLAARGTPNGTSGAAPALRRDVLREVLLHGSVVLLLGSFAIGWVTGPKGMEDVGSALLRPFNAILCVFLLEMGLTVATRLPDLRTVGLRVMAFGLYMPLVGAASGIAAAWLLGLSPGGATLLAVLCASASYIVVPAVLRTALPQASPAIYLTLALGITFPFNLMVGIPLYHGAARALVSAGGAPAAAAGYSSTSPDAPGAYPRP